LNFHAFSEFAHEGLNNAKKTLSMLTRKPVDMESVNSHLVESDSLSWLADYPEEVVLISCVTFSGGIEGQLMVVFKPDSPKNLIDMLEYSRHVNTEDDVESLIESIVCEVANILGSSVLNAISDGLDLPIKPSPPVLIRDMGGAVLASALAVQLQQSDKVYAIDIRLAIGGGTGKFQVVFLSKT
jgi:chemotaxis protein CheC